MDASPDRSQDRSPGATPPPVRRAAALVAAEGLALVLLGAGYAVSGLLGAPEDRLGTVLEGVLALVVGAGLLPAARGLARARSWAVSPTVVVQVLGGVVGIGLLQGGVALVAVPVVVLAAAVLYQLATPESRAAFREPPPGRPG